MSFVSDLGSEMGKGLCGACHETQSLAMGPLHLLDTAFDLSGTIAEDLTKTLIGR
jgi:hypothetical protein